MNRCWICGFCDANSREHIIKSSDLKMMFGKINQSQPLYTVRNDKVRMLQSKDSKAAKFTKGICLKCNSSLTQSNDRAWETLTKYLFQNQSLIVKHGCLNLSKVFPGKTRAALLNIHLYLLKVFGCAVTEFGAPFNLESCSQSILQQVANERFYFAITHLSGASNRVAELSNVSCTNGFLAKRWELSYNLGKFVVVCFYFEKNSVFFSTIAPPKKCTEENQSKINITNCLRVIRNAWHFYYALCLVFKVACGGSVLRCSHLNRALAILNK